MSHMVFLLAALKERFVCAGLLPLPKSRFSTVALIQAVTPLPHVVGHFNKSLPHTG